MGLAAVKLALKQDNMKKTHLFTQIRKRSLFGFVLSALLLTMSSCVEELELPEEGSIPDLTPPSADFSAVESENFLIYTFSNTSKSATDYSWDFGDGGTSTEKEPTHEFAAEGTYAVSLRATDKLGVSNSITKNVEVVEPPEPPAIVPEIINGDFNDSSYDAWRAIFSDGTTNNPYYGSSDGEYVNYDGTSSDSKTRGAKWTKSVSAAHLRSANSRFATQAVTISPNRDYIVEYSYAIKNDKTDVTGGDRVVVSILSGHFADAVDAEISADTNPIVKHVGDIALGKGNFTLVREPFTAPETGLVTIWMYGVTSEDAYIDNVKIYPAE